MLTRLKWLVQSKKKALSKLQKKFCARNHSILYTQTDYLNEKCAVVVSFLKIYIIQLPIIHHCHLQSRLLRKPLRFG